MDKGNENPVLAKRSKAEEYPMEKVSVYPSVKSEGLAVRILVNGTLLKASYLAYPVWVRFQFVAS